MTELIPIQSLDSSAARYALLEATNAADPVRAVSDFLAAIDWSTVRGEPSAEVAELLGEAESISTDAEEGEIGVEVFVAAIRQTASTWRRAIGASRVRAESSMPTVVQRDRPPPMQTRTVLVG